ncbi:MAG: fused signal recognition particle receptor [Eubacteriales bacterium]|nr:fused signal recognition particle receptor [Eubacteriales bacterium]
MSFFSKLKEKLSKTKEGLVEKIENLIASTPKIDESFYEELEEILIQADVGAETSFYLVEELRQRVKKNKIADPAGVREELKEIIRSTLKEGRPLNLNGQPAVIMVVGVNGVGKTTTIGKLAAKFREEGKKVILGAADTFRAAAAEQLEIWARRAGAEIVRHAEGADPAAVAFDAVKAGCARKADVVIIDTAGRLHNKANLMEELKKVRRVIQREIPDAPHEVLLVLDATTGQNALNQARIFREAVDVTGVVLTKLDGTAKGGVIVGIAHEMDLPVLMIGVGEKIEDLRPFDRNEFVEALFAQ